MDNIKTWTGLSVEESIRMTDDRDKLKKYDFSFFFLHISGLRPLPLMFK